MSLFRRNHSQNLYGRVAANDNSQPRRISITAAQEQREAPRVDPPEQGPILREDEPGLVTAAFIQIFQKGTGDFNDALQPVESIRLPFGSDLDLLRNHPISPQEKPSECLTFHSILVKMRDAAACWPQPQFLRARTTPELRSFYIALLSIGSDIQIELCSTYLRCRVV